MSLIENGLLVFMRVESVRRDADACLLSVACVLFVSASMSTAFHFFFVSDMSEV